MLMYCLMWFYWLDLSSQPPSAKEPSWSSSRCTRFPVAKATSYGHETPHRNLAKSWFSLSSETLKSRFRCPAKPSNHETWLKRGHKEKPGRRKIRNWSLSRTHESEFRWADFTKHKPEFRKICPAKLDLMTFGEEFRAHKKWPKQQILSPPAQ